MLENTKPMSVNECWQGRRFKTKKYKEYEQLLFSLLKQKNIRLEKDDKFRLDIRVRVQSKLLDLDNVVKPFVDILQKFYGFNDRQIYELEMIKSVEKNERPYILFSLVKIKGVRK